MNMTALSIGAGGQGGGAHTPHEWFHPDGRELGLKRILLTLGLLMQESEQGVEALPAAEDFSGAGERI